MKAAACTPELTPIKAKIRRFYDVGSPLYARLYGEHIHDGYYLTGKESRAEAQLNLTRLVAEKARIKRGERVLDVGCGMGGSSLWLDREIGARTTGITLSPVQVEIARQRAREQGARSEFLLMDAETMEFSVVFDVVWLVGALTHFEEQGKFLERATGLMAKGSRLALFDWMLDESVEDWRADPQLRLVLRGMLLPSMFSLLSYLEWLRSLRFRVIYVEDITPFTSQTWNDALAVVKQPAIWSLAGKLAADEGRGVFTFLRSLRAMKRAMKSGKVRAGILVAEKL
jgi:tocopherol O-methyltransferase